MDEVTRRDGRLRIAVLAAALVPRLWIAYFTFGSVDAVANLRDSVRVISGVWADTPYFPFNELWLWIAAHLAYYSDLPLTFAYKLLPVAADALIALLLFDAARDRRSGMWAGMLYAFAPVPIIICAVHEQWDSIWLHFLVVALILVRGGSLLRYACAGAVFVLSVAVKPIAAPLVLVLLPRFRRGALAFAGGAAAMLAVYLLVLWRLGWLLDLGNMMGIVDYAQRGILLFGFPHQPMNRLWTLPATVAALLFLMVKRKVSREEVGLLYLVAVMALSGLAPQYLCWPLPFALLCSRMRFVTLYGLLSGLFLLIYYQLPVFNDFNIENLGAWGMLKPFGAWSPPLPPVAWRPIARAAGNYALPLVCLVYVVFELVRVLRTRVPIEEPVPPRSPIALLVPTLTASALVGGLFVWTLFQPRLTDVALIYRIEQKVTAYDVLRYRGPAPPGRGKIWVARSYYTEGLSNRFLNVNTVGVLWVTTWAAAAAAAALRRRGGGAVARAPEPGIMHP